MYNHIHWILFFISVNGLSNVIFFLYYCLINVFPTRKIFFCTNLFYLVDKAEYFIHYFRPNGNYIKSRNDIPEILDLPCPKIKGISLHQSENQCRIFLQCLTNYNGNKNNLRVLLQNRPIKSIVTFSFYFCAFCVVDEI